MAFGDFTVARTSVKRVLNASGVLASVAANTPAFEFNTDGSYRGLLVEPAGTNLALYSEDFTNASWAKTVSASVTGNTGVAPDGTTTADTLTAGANGSQLQFVHVGTSGIAYNASFYIRRVTGTGVVNIRAVENTNIPITVTASWTRVSLSAVSTTTSIRIGLTLDTSGDEVEIWGAQLETGSVATSYIPTVASTATRTADSVTLTGASSLIGQSAGTVFCEVILANASTASFGRVLEVGSATTDRISIDANSSTLLGFLTVGGAATQGGTMSEASANNVAYRIALGYAVGASQGAFYVNGAGDITSPTAVPASNAVYIGRSSSGANGVVAWYRSVALYPTRLANATLQALTT